MGQSCFDNCPRALVIVQFLAELIGDRNTLIYWAKHPDWPASVSANRNSIAI
jgi:hypothetical protein